MPTARVARKLTPLAFSTRLSLLGALPPNPLFFYIHSLISPYIFIHSLITSYVFIHSLITLYVFIHSLITSYIFIHSLIISYIFIYSLISPYVFIHSLITSYVFILGLITYVFIYSLISPYIFIHSLISLSIFIHNCNSLSYNIYGIYNTGIYNIYCLARSTSLYTTFCDFATSSSSFQIPLMFDTEVTLDTAT